MIEYMNKKTKYMLYCGSGELGNLFTKEFLGNLKFMFNSASISMINFPSVWATVRTEMVEYFSPEYVLGQALLITPNVELIHKHKFDFLLIMKNEG